MYRIEPYAPAYGDGIIAVVRAVYDEYGWTWEAAGYHRDLYNIEEYYLCRGGMFWALLAQAEVVGCDGVVSPAVASPPRGRRGRGTVVRIQRRPRGADATALPGADVVGCVGVVPHGEECELHRMYLLAQHRGQGLGRRLIETAMAFGRQCGCQRMRAWSDVKLTAAHRLYVAHGFVQQGERICDDPDKSREYGFIKCF